LAKELTMFWPNSITVAQLEACDDTDEIYDLVMADATAHYERRETELGADVLRQVERQVMLRIIDQRWREHLEEMDYLQGGINLRAMGQKDPLVEWQREGFEMFGAMMTGIAQDFVKYVMHVQVVQNEPQPAQAAPTVQNVQTSSSDDVDSTGFDRAARAAVAEGDLSASSMPAQPAAPKQRTVVKDDFEKTPRNAPCPCGSGKKFKLCHGAA
jgi:preprotein translocase subunit SecA